MTSAPALEPAPLLSLLAAAVFGQRGGVTASLEVRAARGDRGALAELLRAHAAAVHRLCHFSVGASDAADLAQQSLERAVLRLERFDPARGSFRAWVLGIARHACLDHLRRRGLERGAFVAEGDGVLDEVAAGPRDPEARWMARLDAAKLAPALDALPEGMRSALVLFHLEDATYDEISRVLDVPIGTVMTWLHRGRRKLRAALEAGAGEIGGDA